MKLISVGLAAFGCLIGGCSGGDDRSSASGAKPPTPPRGKQQASDFDIEAYQRLKEEGLAYAQKLSEERARNPPAKRVPLPNFRAGAGLPRPLGLNFYEERNEYPGYLLCSYDVEENHYDESNELGWFEAALLQMRGVGPDRFPPLKWVAVIICNRAEHSGVSTFEQSHKVGAIFNLNEVFDRASDPRRLAANATMDRHPFVYDVTRRTPGEQQRWVIVERDMLKRRVKR